MNRQQVLWKRGYEGPCGYLKGQGKQNVREKNRRCTYGQGTLSSCKGGRILENGPRGERRLKFIVLTSQHRTRGGACRSPSIPPLGNSLATRRSAAKKGVRETLENVYPVRARAGTNQHAEQPPHVYSATLLSRSGRSAPAPVTHFTSLVRRTAITVKRTARTSTHCSGSRFALGQPPIRQLYFIQSAQLHPSTHPRVQESGRRHARQLLNP
jgi:hypothetical protein